MTTLITQRALCPMCGRLARDRTVVTNGTIVTAHYLCEVSHAWQSKWSVRGVA